MTAAVELAEVVIELEGEGRSSRLSLAVESGEFLVLLGPNRSGKSLILELCAGLVTPQAGAVRVFGYDWADLTDAEAMELRLHIGTVLQQPGLLSNMTLFNNVALPLRYHRADLSEQDIRRTVMAHLDSLGIARVSERFPAQLNPGEIRCAAIARAMILDQELLLLDDPVAGLDADMVIRLVQHLAVYRDRRSLTIVATLRAPSPFMDLANRVALVRGGRIDAIGPRAALAQLAGAGMEAYRN